MRTKARLFWIAATATLVSAGIHLYQTWTHYQFKFGFSEGKSFCSINAQLDCDAVNTSIYSELFNVPLALWGFVASLFLMLALVKAALNPEDERVALGSYWAATFVALVSLVMAFISHTELGIYCLMCMGNYVLSFIAFGVLWPFRKGASIYFIKTLPQLFWPLGLKWEFVFIGGTVVMAFLMNSIIVSNMAEGLDVVVQESVAEWQVNPEKTLDLNDGMALKPTGTYKMTIVEFADFLCSHCKHAASSLYNFASTRKDVQFIFKNFPLDGSCNTAMEKPGDSCPLAKAVYCAQKQNQGWPMYHWLFENQGKIFASQAANPPFPLNSAELQICITAQESHEAMLRQSKEGATAGIKGTPSIFVNGRLLPRGQIIPVLEAVRQKL